MTTRTTNKHYKHTQQTHKYKHTSHTTQYTHTRTHNKYKHKLHVFNQ